MTLRYKNQTTGARYSGQKDVLINRSIHKLVVLLAFEEQAQELVYLITIWFADLN